MEVLAHKFTAKAYTKSLLNFKSSYNNGENIKHEQRLADYVFEDCRLQDNNSNSMLDEQENPC